jgi:hypothetical protein
VTTNRDRFLNSTQAWKISTSAGWFALENAFNVPHALQSMQALKNPAERPLRFLREFAGLHD